MAENPQLEIFNKICSDLEKLCENTSNIKEAVRVVDVNDEEAVDKIYENLQCILSNSEEVFSEIKTCVETGKEQWLEQKKNKSKGDVDVDNKVGTLRLVSLDKLLDPNRLNGKKDDNANLTKQKQVNRTKAVSVIQKNNLCKDDAVVVEIDSSSEDEEEIKKRRCNSNVKRIRRISGNVGSATKKKAKKTESTCSGDGVKVELDAKFDWKAYVPLPRIECEKLKEYYLKKPEMDSVM